MKTRLGAIVLSLALAAGSVWAADDAASKYSGFLGDYSQLKPAPDREGIMRYVNKSIDLRSYTKLMFDPVEIYLAPNPEYKGLQPDALKRMTDNFVASFKLALQSGYEVVSAPGPDVLRVRLAITGVQPASPSLNATDFLPIKALFNLGRSAAGEAPKVAEMSTEMEVLDANGHRVAAVVANRKGDKHLEQGAQVKWEDLAPIADYWAKIFRQGLDEARGIAAK